MRDAFEDAQFADRFDLDEFEVNEIVNLLVDETYEYLGNLDTEDLGLEELPDPDDSPDEE